MRLILGVGLAALALAVPCDGQGNTSPVIDKLLAEFVDAYNKKDTAKVASLYAEDGVLMPSNAPMVRRTAIEAVFKKQFRGQPPFPEV